MERTGAQSEPDRAAALEQYRAASSDYDRHMRPFARWQRMAVERLALSPGESVIDVACGTGLNFPLLEGRVGPGGHVVGIDLSPEMLAQARERATAHGWQNVTLIEAAVEGAELDLMADAALFSFTHDVLQSPQAVANVIAHLHAGASVASVGAKLGSSWNVPVNYFVRRSARPYMTTFRGLERPWRELERYAEMHHRTLAWAEPTWFGVASPRRDPPWPWTDRTSRTLHERPRSTHRSRGAGLQATRAALSRDRRPQAVRCS